MSYIIHISSIARTHTHTDSDLSINIIYDAESFIILNFSISSIFSQTLNSKYNGTF